MSDVFVGGRYACFRRMYARYLSRLHTVSSDSGCIIQVTYHAE